MVAKMGGKTHLLHRVVHLVELPQEAGAVQQAVNPPLDEVPDHKAHQQHPPQRQVAQGIGGLQVEAACRGADAIVEEPDYQVGSGIVDHQGEQEEVEEHVKGVQPEVLPEAGLVLPPGRQQFQPEKEGRHPQEPVEIVVPAGMGDFIPKIVGVTAVAIQKSLDVFHVVIIFSSF